MVAGFKLHTCTTMRGVFACVLAEIKEIEKARCKLINNQHCAMLMNYVNVNELKAQDHELLRRKSLAQNVAV